MASLIIRNIDDQLKLRLRVVAAESGRSMEEEAREILKAALARQQGAPRNLAAAIRARFSDIKIGPLPEIEPQPLRQPPEFD
jgi:antitoxin FitA